jgi:hypothetical protein
MAETVSPTLSGACSKSGRDERTSGTQNERGRSRSIDDEFPRLRVRANSFLYCLFSNFCAARCGWRTFSQGPMNLGDRNPKRDSWLVSSCHGEFLKAGGASNEAFDSGGNESPGYSGVDKILRERFKPLGRLLLPGIREV